MISESLKELLQSTTRGKSAISALIRLASGWEDCLAETVIIRYGRVTMVFDNRCCYEACHSRDKFWYRPIRNERPNFAGLPSRIVLLTALKSCLEQDT